MAGSDPALCDECGLRIDAHYTGRLRLALGLAATVVLAETLWEWSFLQGQRDDFRM